MSYNDPHLIEKQKDCLRLYLEHHGSDHDVIEQKMHELGWTNFSRRIMHSRNERGKHVKGWIEALGWKDELRRHFVNLGYEPLESKKCPKATDRTLARQGQATTANTNAGKPNAFNPESAAEPPVNGFHAWLKVVSPEYDWDAKHHKYICEQLAKMDAGEIKRLMIFVPPRHGKSELVTVRYAAWTMRNDPSKNIVIGSYGQKLASNFSRKIKRVLGHDWALKTGKTATQAAGNMDHDAASCNANRAAGILACSAASLGVTESDVETMNVNRATATFTASSQFITNGSGASLTATNGHYAGGTTPDGSGRDSVEEECPFPFVSSRLKNTEAEWETKKGGGLRAVGVGGGITGYGADLIIVDDPVKSRAEAESKTRREAVWDWFNDDIYTRLEPNGNMILIQTRWHEDDLAGRLLKRAEEGEGERWSVINLPALATGPRASRRQESEPEAIATGLETLDRPPGEIKKNTKPKTVGKAEFNNKPAAEKPKAIGFPRLYSRIEPDVIQPTGAACIPDRTASGSLACEMNEAIDPGKWDACGSVSTDQINREPGESLWPQRYPIEKLEQRRQQIGTYSFSSLYQQQPVPAEGGMFKRAWFGRIISAAPPGLRWIRGYDLGTMASENADFTASFRVAFDKDENMYIDGGYRRRIEFPDQRRYILSRLTTEANTFHVVEGTLNGFAVVHTLNTERPARRHLLRAMKVNEPKTARVIDWINIAEQGRMLMVRGAWNEEFISECCSFPLGTHDDQVDAVSLAVNASRRSRGAKLHRF
ncbi:MAG: terminase family protein [Pyrinomonadaceae bacterium]